MRSISTGVARRTTFPRNSAFRTPHSALVHIDEASLNCREEGEVTHAVTHTPHPTQPSGRSTGCPPASIARARSPTGRSEEHTSELQSHSDLVCRLLLEKKKKQKKPDRRQNSSRFHT